MTAVNDVSPQLALNVMSVYIDIKLVSQNLRHVIYSLFRVKKNARNQMFMKRSQQPFC